MQTAQTQNLTAAIAGMVYGDPRRAEYYTDRVAEVAILMGLFVTAGTAPATQAKLPATSAAVQQTGLGFAVYDATKPTAPGVTVAEYEIGEPISVLHTGYVFAFGEEAMAFGDSVFVRITSDGGSNTVLGKVRNDADSARCVQLFGARVAQTSSGAGPVLLEVLHGTVAGATGATGPTGPTGPTP